uniref:hypothetical protein n=1 Tax=Methylobacterium sp. B34 TaxID=95563 RepID=UPI00195522C5
MDNGQLISIDQEAGAEEVDFSMPPIFLRNGAANQAFQSLANRLIHPHRPRLRQRLTEMRDPD